MLIKLIVIGRLKSKPIAALADDFLARIRFDAKVEIQEFKDSGKESENKRMLEALIKEQGYIIALSEEGVLLGSEVLAHKLNAVQRKLVFVIGGPYGLSDQVKARADLTLSLSPLTFTHEMARLILLEQIFRAITIIQGRGYHNQ
ncbi:MAG: 23S rRNA (pseudouridine(1915)-N(3))-methyltransferase RlmH [Kiritimatiellae bacterium]|nr:23S rRNA (pseudouridine(1915)-N(3))-methyltransferase RlmH [Kiritimatiellia bacterium]